MSLGSWIVLALVVLCAALAIRTIVRDRKNGASSSCGGCTACSAGRPGGSGVKLASCPAAENMVSNINDNLR